MTAFTRTALLGLLLGACLSADLGPAPFTCELGLCPRGYRCASKLCVALGEPDPPRELTVVGGPADPMPVWLAERGFAVGWTQESDSALGGPGLYSAALSPLGVSPPVQLAMSRGDLAFAVVHPPGGSELLTAVRVNRRGQSRLDLYRQTIGDLLDGGSAYRLAYSLTVPLVPEGYGFSVPSLSAANAAEVTLAFAFTAPPTSVADNVYCVAFDLATGAADAGCRPSPAVTAGTFADEASVVVGARGRLLFWRDLSVHVTGEIDGAPVGRRDLPLARLLHPAMVGARVAAAVRSDPLDGGASYWGLGLASTTSTQFVPPRVLQPGVVVPHLVAASDRFVACGLDDSGELEVAELAAEDLSALAAPRKVHRVSRATIESCRLAVAPDGTVAVAWRERVGSAGDVFRVFATLLLPTN